MSKSSSTMRTGPLKPEDMGAPPPRGACPGRLCPGAARHLGRRGLPARSAPLGRVSRAWEQAAVDRLTHRLYRGRRSAPASPLRGGAGPRPNRSFRPHGLPSRHPQAHPLGEEHPADHQGDEDGRRRQAPQGAGRHHRRAPLRADAGPDHRATSRLARARGWRTRCYPAPGASRWSSWSSPPTAAWPAASTPTSSAAPTASSTRTRAYEQHPGLHHRPQGPRLLPPARRRHPQGLRRPLRSG